MNRSKKSVERIPNPMVGANLLSKISFWWLRDIFKKGYRRPLFANDMYETIPSMDSAKLTGKFVKLWNDEVNSINPSMLSVIYRAYGPELLIFAILFCIFETGYKVVQIFSLGGLVSYFVPGQTEISRNMAWIFGAGIVVPTFVRCFIYNQYMLWALFIGNRVRIGCCGLVYRKILRLSKVSANEGLSGRAINILSNDLAKLDSALTYVAEVFRGPVETILYGWLMYMQIGISAVIGVGFMLLFMPVQAWAAKKTAFYRLRTAERTDIRVKLMNEIIQGIQVIKMYAWEKSFAAVVAKVRQKELVAIRGTIYIQAALRSIFMISGISVFLSLVSYVLLGDRLTAKKVFMVSSFFNALCDSFVYLWPQGLTFMAEVYITTKRLRDFLLEDGGNGAANTDKPFERRIFNTNTEKKSIIFDSATAYWTSKKDVGANVAFKDVNITVNEGELLAVVGAVGSGKSSLLSAIIGELEPDKGFVIVNGTVSYACQEAWVFEGTIRDNILFVEDFDEERYKKVIQVCALEKDFQLLPYGDLTIVGERGISLSGGQKARVNLARAIYRKADIYLLDDPLSAVDTHVGRHIFDKCIKDYLQKKICVLVTHQVQFLRDVEKVIVLSNGEIEERGRFRDLENMEELQFLEEACGHGDNVQGKTDDIEASINDECWKEKSEDKGEERDEHQAEGAIGFDVYKAYFKSMDGFYILFIISFLFLTSRTVLSGVDYFLSRWVNWEQQVSIGSSTETQCSSCNNTSENKLDLSEEEFQRERFQFLEIYSVLLGIGFVLFLSRTYGFFFMCLRMSLRLHDQLFRSITRATMQFFNINSSGRILNRFSRDIYSVDTALPMAMLICVTFVMDITAILVIVGITNYWLFIPTFIILIIFFIVRKIYVKTSRSLKRVESMTRSPVYSHTNQTLQGLTTVRAFNAQDILEHEFHTYQNLNTSAWCLFLSANRALALWLDIICILYISVVTFSFLLMENQFESGDVGLALMNCINMVGMCQWGLRQMAEFENQMTSVERVVEYIREPSEASLETPKMYKPSEEWPEQGAVKLINVGMKYATNKDCILKDLNFEIVAGEKVGIVGRTGAGKSSIIQAMFRLAINEGVIEIDGIDIDNLGLHDLRNAISIIPQDPVVFSGQLRYNLDPFGLASDSDIWKALEDVELKAYVSKIEGGLNTMMSESGSNFSMGQRQLVCLARAILRNNRILIMDEATANVDPDTDQLIQNAIRTKFSKCTVLTIAHRLHTVMDNDRILVMDSGSAVEFGCPYELLKNPDGFLSKLVAKTGNDTALALNEIAKSSFEAKKVVSKKID